MVHPSRISKWMYGKGREGKLVNLNQLSKGPQLVRVKKLNRARLIAAIDRDLGRDPTRVRSSHYAKLSGLGRVQIMTLASARRKLAGISTPARRGGERFKFPDELYSVAQKAIDSLPKSGKRTIFVRDILVEYARRSRNVVYAASLHDMLQRTLEGRNIEISTKGSFVAERELLSEPGMRRFRAFVKNSH
ncbi:MAG TPA: hypothetical protein VJG83_02875 [archaeon]|nr:hypothetical protein [archaeon]